MPNADPPPLSGEIAFTQSFIPPLPDGEYLVTVQQTVLNTDPQGSWDQIDESYAQTRRIAVQGERFRLNPGELNAVFPPANNQGEYANVLPHAVLSRKTLLWERSPDGTSSGRPWLALLLFDANDPVPAVQTVHVGDLQRQPFVADQGAGGTVPSSLPASAVSYADGFAKLSLAFTLEYGQSWSDACQAIDVPVTLWNQIAPSLDDLGWLGHARTVSTSNKARSGPAPSANGSSNAATYSVIIGSRMPPPNTQCTVHLVSLEGMAAYLPVGEDYTPASITLPDGSPAASIRLVSLSNWSFASTDPTESFEGYLTSLNAAPFQRVPSGPAPPPSDPKATVANAFAMGYTAVNHLTRQGDQTVSWYRGPFVPFEVPETIIVPAPDPVTDMPTPQINTADELIRYDPGMGMMDVSYGAAWELGRLLACQNKSFSTALCSWKNRNVQQTAQTLSRQVTAERFGAALGVKGVPEGRALHDATAAFILKHVTAHLQPTSARPGRRNDEAQS